MRVFEIDQFVFEAGTPKFSTSKSALAGIAKSLSNEPTAIDNKLFSVLKKSLYKLYGAMPGDSEYNPAVKKAEKAFTTVAAYSLTIPNKAAFLHAVIDTINPNTVWKPGMNIKPGQHFDIDTIDEPLSAKAMASLPSPEAKAKIDDLVKKIEANNIRLAQLKAEQDKLNTANNKALAAKNKIHSGLSEKELGYFSYIEKNCSDYLKYVAQTKKFLYRGQRDVTHPIYIGYPRADRRPKDSDEKGQELLDNVLLSRGFTAVRGNSLFTTGDIFQAESYGTAYVIFPLNGFSFTWSKENDDLIIHDVTDLTGFGMDESSYDLIDEFNKRNSTLYDIAYNGELSNVIEYRYETKFKKELDYDQVFRLVKMVEKTDEFNILNQKYTKFAETDEENPVIAHKAMIEVCNAAFKFNEKFPGLLSKDDIQRLNKEVKNAEKFLPKNSGSDDDGYLNKLANRIMKKYQFDNKDFKSALQSKHEVYIHGQYIALHHAKYKESIRKYFLSSNVVDKKTPTKKKGK